MPNTAPRSEREEGGEAMNPRGRRRQETENIVGRSYPTETIERPRWPRNSLSLSLARYKQTACQLMRLLRFSMMTR